MGNPDLVVHANLGLCRLGFALASCTEGKTCLCLLSDMILQASDLHFCQLYHVFQQKGAWFHHTTDLLYFLCSKMCSHLNKIFSPDLFGEWMMNTDLGNYKERSY